MGWTDLVLRLRALLTHNRAEGELDEELRFHMEMEARKRRAAGHCPTKKRGGAPASGSAAWSRSARSAATSAA
jgi:hypothetical protein